uniref:HDC12287 n=1 Tax=Drosophila melanogaster TaxID=7227 RepID=Q6IKJ4_DROME|nr:TPA_inf: HDC12287 [Drosophila melanogaster]
MYFTYNDYQTKDCIGRICLSSFAFETPLRNPVSHWTIAGAFERSRRQCNVHFALATLHLSDFKLRPSRRMALVMMVLANASVAGVQTGSSPNQRTKSQRVHLAKKQVKQSIFQIPCWQYLSH